MLRGLFIEIGLYRKPQIIHKLTENLPLTSCGQHATEIEIINGNMNQKNAPSLKINSLHKTQSKGGNQAVIIDYLENSNHNTTYQILAIWPNVCSEVNWYFEFFSLLSNNE